MQNDADRDSKYVEHLSEFIEKEYNISITDILPAKRGFYGETWRVNTLEKSFFVKLDYTFVHKEVYRKSFSILEHLTNSGIDYITKIIKTADGKLYTKFDDAIIGVFEWIDGEDADITDNSVKIIEYQMLSKIYKVHVENIDIKKENFNCEIVVKFYDLWDKLDNNEISQMLKRYSALLEHKMTRLKYFAEQCKSDMSGFYITHGDTNRNMIMEGSRYFIIDWDDPMLAPPERDAWFCLSDWSIDAFNSALKQEGIEYSLRSERLSYYACYSFFLYLTEFIERFLDGRDMNSIITEINTYICDWLEAEMRYAVENV